MRDLVAGCFVNHILINETVDNGIYMVASSVQSVSFEESSMYVDPRKDFHTIVWGFCFSSRDVWDEEVKKPSH